MPRYNARLRTKALQIAIYQDYRREHGRCIAFRDYRIPRIVRVMSFCDVHAVAQRGTRTKGLTFFAWMLDTRARLSRREKPVFGRGQKNAGSVPTRIPTRSYKMDQFFLPSHISTGTGHVNLSITPLYIPGPTKQNKTKTKKSQSLIPWRRPEIINVPVKRQRPKRLRILFTYTFILKKNYTAFGENVPEVIDIPSVYHSLRLLR